MKTRKTKLLSLMLCIIMTMSIIPMNTITAAAYAYTKSLNVTLELPVLGNNVVNTKVISSSDYYSYDVEWCLGGTIYKPGSVANERDSFGVGFFKAEKYIAKIYIRRENPNFVLAEDVQVTINNTIPAYNYLVDDVATSIFTAEFTALPRISDISLISSKPIAGQKPDDTVSIADDSVDKDQYTASGFGWYKGGTVENPGTLMEEGETFNENETYIREVMIIPNEGYGIYDAANVKINGKQATLGVKNFDSEYIPFFLGSYTYRVAFKIKPNINEVIGTSSTGDITPVYGSKLANPTISSNGEATFNSEASDSHWDKFDTVKNEWVTLDKDATVSEGKYRYCSRISSFEENGDFAELNDSCKVIVDDIEWTAIKNPTTSAVSSYGLSYSPEFIIEKPLKSLRIDSNPTKIDYIFGEAIDKNGLKVTAIYIDDTEKDVTQDVEVLNFDTAIPGDREAKIRYMDKTEPFNYTVELPSVTELKFSQTKSSISATWDKVNSATSYYVSIYLGDELFAFDEVSADTTSYTFNKLSAATKYIVDVTAIKTIDDIIYKSETKTLETATKTATPKIKKLVAGKKKATLYLSNVKRESGYQVYRSSKKTKGYKKAATLKIDAKKVTIKKLKSKKKAYFKVRSFIKTTSGKVYSSWSKVKYVKIK